MEILIGAHDPEGRMLKRIPGLKDVLDSFDRGIAAVTPFSHPEIGTELENIGFKVLKGSANFHETRMVRFREATGDVYVTELDKLLHTQQYFSEHLKMILESKPNGMILFGRSQKAFDMHPDSWKENEIIANRELAKLLRLPSIDIGTGDFVADKRTVDLLKGKEILPGVEVSVEMIADVILAGIPFQYIESDVYEWEDPDRYETEIKEEGYEEWKKRLYDSEKEWNRRRGELQDYLRAIERFKQKLKTPSY